MAGRAQPFATPLLATPLLLAALLLSGCGSAPAAHNVLHERALVLPPGPDGFAEVNLILDAGQEVSWDWSANATSLYFNVHSHPSGPAGPVTEHVRRLDAQADKGSFAAPSSGTYSLLWENTGSHPIALQYEVRGEGALDPEHPPSPTGIQARQ